MSKKKGWAKAYWIATKGLPEWPMIVFFMPLFLKITYVIKIGALLCHKNTGGRCLAHSFSWSKEADKPVNPKMLHEWLLSNVWWTLSKWWPWRLFWTPARVQNKVPAMYPISSCHPRLMFNWWLCPLLAVIVAKRFCWIWRSRIPCSY